jgi:hypothetical protein
MSSDEFSDSALGKFLFVFGQPAEFALAIGVRHQELVIAPALVESTDLVVVGKRPKRAASSAITSASFGNRMGKFICSLFYAIGLIL